MENTYGIGVKNRYELFYDEDVDPLEIIRETEQAKEKRKTDKTQTKEKTKNVKVGKTNSTVGLTKKPKESPPANVQKQVETTEITSKPRTRPFSDRSLKSPRNFEDKDTEERKNFRNRDDHAVTGSETRERDGEVRRGRGGFRGRGRPRGRGNFFNSDNRPPRREFDRHSGSDRRLFSSGVKAVEKKDGAGSNNWGDMHSEINSSHKREPDSAWDEEFESSGDKQNDSNWDSMPETFSQSPGKEEISVEKPDESVIENIESKENLPVGEERSDESMKEMTLDEWKKEQEAKRAVPKYNLRKPGEGEDGNQWKKLYILKKKAKEDGDEEEEDDEEDVDDEEFARRGRHRQLVDIQINFNDSRRGRGRARGGRGGAIGPRSGGPVGNKEVQREERREPLIGSNVGGRSYRGSMKMNKSGQQSAPRVDDWNDFPSLVTA